MPERQAPTDEVVGRAPPATRGFPSLVLLHPLAGDGGVHPPVTPDTVVIDQEGMQFIPDLALARPGQPVSFTNHDDTPHIVTVRKEGGASTLLDEAIDMGGRLGLTFPEAGTYTVSCGMHPGMVGLVVVSDAVYTTTAGRDGAWRIPDVPPGTYAVEVWNADAARRWRDTLEVGAGTTVVPERKTSGGR